MRRTWTRGKEVDEEGNGADESHCTHVETEAGSLVLVIQQVNSWAETQTQVCLPLHFVFALTEHDVFGVLVQVLTMHKKEKKKKHSGILGHLTLQKKRTSCFRDASRADSAFWDGMAQKREHNDLGWITKPLSAHISSALKFQVICNAFLTELWSLVVIRQKDPNCP